MYSNSQIHLVLYTPEFKRNLRQLAKKYRHIKSDIEPSIEALIQGKTPGNIIKGIRYEVLKVRAKNSDAKKGKSSGYRILYYHLNDKITILITIYSKTEQSDITPLEIRRIIANYDTQGSCIKDTLSKSGHT
jgi:mRNA-degrading endonuclease RelE of RelBE toxin-antitoxin system